MTRPLTPRDLVYGLTLAGDPQVSPGGDLIAYTLTTAREQARPVRQVWLCRIDGSDARPLTVPETPAAGARWSPGGDRLAFAAARDGRHTLCILDLSAAGEPAELASHGQPLGELAWSPNARAIAYTTLYDPENPLEEIAAPGAAPKVRVTRRLDFKEDGRGYLGDRRTQVFTVDVEDGSRLRLTSEPLEHDLPQWSPDGRFVGMREHLQDRAGQRLIAVDVASGAIEELGGGSGAMIVHWAFSPDGERVLFAADPDQSFQPDYFLHSRASGATRRVTSDLQSFPDTAPPVWIDDRQALFHSCSAGASALELLDVETGAVDLLERTEARRSGLSLDRGMRAVAQEESSLDSIGELGVFDRTAGSSATITAHNAALLTEAPPAAWETLVVDRGDFSVDAWLLKPRDFDPARRYPLILDVHGGPSANYGYGFLAHEQCLSTNGFLVLFANPRGSTSYGRRFAEQIVRGWGQGDYEDLLAVLDAVLERPYADGERTGIFGISYGGYMTAWAIGQSDRFRAAVCGEPIFDLESDYGTSDVAWRGLERHGGGPPHLEREWYTEFSPSTYAHRIRTPTLIFHGEADQRCPIGQSEQMFVALRKAGCETEYVRYPGGSHMFFAHGLPEHRVDFLTRTLAWFKEHLGEPTPRASPATSAASSRPA
ncbi:MAG: S9 family peptidase [Gaiellaceae bacterium MAG52_C11]|nr:S9 family peptidase [Candidatus Gaiellasilicea maunaloa]